MKAVSKLEGPGVVSNQPAPFSYLSWLVQDHATAYAVGEVVPTTAKKFYAAGIDDFKMLTYA